MIISIHQPNFFPFYPFFQKMNDADLFVILENCQFEKNNYQNRFNKEGRWHTMSTNKGLDPIVNKKYLNPLPDWNRIKFNLKEYKFLSQFDDCICSSLSETNFNIISKIKDILNIKTEIFKDYPTELTSSERLVDICKKYDAKKYISGISGRNYLDIKLFESENIEVVFQDEHQMIKLPVIDIIKNKLSNV